jgi:polyphosphate kinase
MRAAVEILFSVTSPVLVRRLIGILETRFADTVKAWRLRRDGSCERVRATGPALRAQERFYLDAVETTRAARGSLTRFRPLGRPEE